MEAALITDSSDARTFKLDGVDRLTRSYKTTTQSCDGLVGRVADFTATTSSRAAAAKRDPADPAKLAMTPANGSTRAGDRYGYLPQFRAPCGRRPAAAPCDPIQPEWVGQEAIAFPDNWSIGLSFLHNRVRARAQHHRRRIPRHGAPRTRRRLRAAQSRQPLDSAITYDEISNDELFEIARLIVAAEIAKIHTIEWTPQLLYDEPLYIGMNANWSGLFARIRSLRRSQGTSSLR